LPLAWWACGGPMAGRPDLDPGTLGLKVQVKTFQHDSFQWQLVSKPLERATMSVRARDGVQRRETQCTTVWDQCPSIFPTVSLTRGHHQVCDVLRCSQVWLLIGVSGCWGPRMRSRSASVSLKRGLPRPAAPSIGRRVEGDDQVGVGMEILDELVVRQRVRGSQ
jgi:hypothetical protein